MFKRISWVIIISFAIAAGCKKPNSYPDTPVITFKSLTVQQENGFDVSVHLIVSFTDGDGDIGNNSPEAGDPPNFVVLMDTLHNGNWGTNDNHFIFSGTLPYLTPTGSNRALKGDVATDILLQWGHPNDTIRYQVYIVDRAMNQSNTIITPEIIIHTE
jgi:hypothetical protein